MPAPFAGIAALGIPASTASRAFGGSVRWPPGAAASSRRPRRRYRRPGVEAVVGSDSAHVADPCASGIPWRTRSRRRAGVR
eukprot:scaffold1638_cov258-Pinguiococcus_pyrenoidosus.AAC.1